MPLYRRDQGLKRTGARGGFVLRRAKGVALASLIMPLAIRFSTQFSPMTVTSGVIASMTDLITGTITMTPAGATGFDYYEDWLGRKAARANIYSGPTPPSSQIAQGRISNGFTKTGTNWNHSMVYYFVMSNHRVTTGGPMINGTDAGGATLSNGPGLGTTGNGRLRGHGKVATDGRMVPGTNLQVVIVRTTSTGVRIWRNGVAETVAVAPSTQSATGFFGALVGGSGIGWDWYEMGACLSSTGYTDANMEADGRALMSAFGLVDETATWMDIGDSIYAGFKLVGSGDNLSMKTRDHLPLTVRHIGYGVSGDTTSTVKERIANVLGCYTAAHPCYFGLAIGVNDIGGAPARPNAQDIFDTFPFVNGTSTIIDIGQSVLAAGPQARFVSVVNIAVGNTTNMAVISALRSLIRGSTLLTNLDAQPGGANAGRVFRSDYVDIAIGGQTYVSTSTDAASAKYQEGLHPTIATNALLGPVVAAQIVAVLP